MCKQNVRARGTVFGAGSGDRAGAVLGQVVSSCVKLCQVASSCVAL